MTTFTAAEVAALFDLDERRIRKEVELGVLEASTPPRYTLPAVLYLRTVAQLGFELSVVADRKRLAGLIADAFESSPTGSLRIELSPIVSVTLDFLRADTLARIERFEAWKGRLVTDDAILAGEPVFPESRLAVRQIGGMRLRGASVAELREDYPYLDDDDIELARTYTRAYPVMGRPRERQAAAR
jgi:uncharacterized protein (DUF433 family)